MQIVSLVSPKEAICKKVKVYLGEKIRKNINLMSAQSALRMVTLKGCWTEIFIFYCYFNLLISCGKQSKPQADATFSSLIWVYTAIYTLPSLKNQGIKVLHFSRVNNDKFT